MCDATVLTAAAGAAAGASIDLATRRVPNVLSFGLAGAGLLLAAGGYGHVGFGAAVAGALLGLVLMLPGHVIGATGAGDVKLLGAFGSLLGPVSTVRAFVYSLVAGGVLAAIVAIRRGRLLATIGRTAELVGTAGANKAEIEHVQSDNRFAYAPAIAAAALAVALGF